LVLCCFLYCCLCIFFFFQAEDGIRDRTVTGVQTCALPILVSRVGTTDTGFAVAQTSARVGGFPLNSNLESALVISLAPGSYTARSEERRVGKECRFRCAADS